MKKRAVLVILLYLVSCAVITVNVYFPDKEVKEAYQDLEKELMNPSERPPAKTPGKKSSAVPRIEWVSTALAQDAGLAANIAAIVKGMPDVVSSYREMGARLNEVHRLKDSGAVGEGNNGLLIIRDEKQITASDRALINAENANRTTVINGMARAILQLNKAPENEKNIAQVRPQAARQFADLRRDKAHPGWWVQDPSGAWIKK